MLARLLSALGLLALGIGVLLHEVFSHYVGLLLQWLDPTGMAIVSYAPQIGGLLLILAGIMVVLWPKLHRIFGKGIPTELNLQFDLPPAIPTEIGHKNLWRWWFQRIRFNTFSSDGAEGPSAEVGVLVWIFDRPTAFRQIKVIGHNLILPPHEIRDFSERYAFIVFSGIVPQGQLELRLLN